MNIIELFATAQQHLKWPKLTIPYQRPSGVAPNGFQMIHFKPEKIVFIPINKKHFRSDSVLWVTNGLKKENGGIIYGMVTTKPSFAPSKFLNRDSDLAKLIVDICKDPVKHAKIKGLEFSHCCFCGLELTNKNSLIAGYGPICAEKWGLPWDGLADEKELGDL